MSGRSRPRSAAAATRDRHSGTSPTTTSRNPQTSRKRRHPEPPPRRKQQEQEEQEQQPPSPPPPPPASLVRLLQKDPKVLQYFQALQSNLAWDVEKWKRRTRNLEAEKEQKKNEWGLVLPSPHSHPDEALPKSTHHDDDNKDDRKKDSKNINNNGNDSSTDDEEDDDDNPHDNNHPEVEVSTRTHAAQAPVTHNSSASCNDDDDDDDADSWFSLDIPTATDTNPDKKALQATPPPPPPATAATTTKLAGKRPSSSFGIHRRNKIHSTSANLSESSSDDEDDDDDDDDDDDEYAWLYPTKPAVSTTAAAVAARMTTEETTIATDSISSSPTLSSTIYQQLSDVYDDLENLGIPLLHQQVLDEIPANDIENGMNPMEGENEEPYLQKNQEHRSTSDTFPATTAVTTPTTTTMMTRRSDQQVITSILQFLKILSRIKNVVSIPSSEDRTTSSPESSLRPSFYFPFMSTAGNTKTKDSDHKGSRIPCYLRLDSVSDDWQHPAVMGIERLLICLCWMDVLSPTIDEDVRKEEGYKLSPIQTTNIPSSQNMASASSQQDEYRKIRLAFYGRKSMMNDLLQSIHGEIVETWPSEDRTNRLQTDSTQLDPNTIHTATQTESDNMVDLSDDEGDSKPPPDKTKGIPYGVKNHSRLSALMERCFHAKLVVTLYLARGDTSSAFQLIWSYILATAPCHSVEDYPRLPPVQSFCILEAMLATSVPRRLQTHQGKSSSCESTLIWLEQKQIDNMSVSDVFESLALTFNCTARIYQDRNLPNLDDRVTDISVVELAAYKRLMTGSNRLTIQTNNINEETYQWNDVSGDGRISVPFRLLRNVVHGNADSLDESATRLLFQLQETGESGVLHDEFLACISAKRELEIRQLDTYRRVVITPMVFAPNHTGKFPIVNMSKQLIDSILARNFNTVPLSTLITAFRTCHVSGDGTSLLRLAFWCMTRIELESCDDGFLRSVQGILESSSHAVVVRVINLKRRPDRMAAFMSQAMLNHFSVIKGVTDLIRRTRPPKGENDFLNEALVGDYAVDGQGKAAEVEQNLLNLVGGDPADLNRLVETHWYPNELKPFDIDAPISDRSVLISPSEKACALSHIACWKGVDHALSSIALHRGDGQAPCIMSRLRQRFHISGYAQGPSLSGESMEPTPVCVIFEDDAVLVDRFTDRLACVLQDLPRDFHFCSLGYSRPKTAPLVPFSEHVSVPTSIWYLTGYLLSLEGARFLLDKLPVRGPVDSWIGMAMFTNNWDNVFGRGLGVGVTSKPSQDLYISRPNLKKILRFRAFAATIPLCSQRVGKASDFTIPRARKGWRQRDTDIVYSGTI